MKKLLWISLITLLAMVFCFGGVASAAETEDTLPDPGITPDSPFYFMDQWGKSLSMAFTFNSQEKAEKAMRYADERMAELEAMLAQNKYQHAEKAAKSYQNYLESTDEYMEQARLKGNDVSEKVALMAEKHLGYLCDTSGNMTEEMLQLMTQTREKAMSSQESALKKMAQGNPEKAAELSLQMMERQLNRIQVQAEEEQGEAVQARLEIYNRLGNLGDNITQIARQLGKETTVDQLVGMATANQVQVLSQVREKVGEAAQNTIDTVIQNRIQTHEQIVTRLQEQNRLGEVPEDVAGNMTQNRYENTVRSQTMTENQTQSQTNDTTPSTGAQTGPSNGAQQGK